MPSCSAWPPDVRVLLHFSHLKQGRCQSFPREVTFSAAMERRWISRGTEQVSFGRLASLSPALRCIFGGIFSSLFVQDRGHHVSNPSACCAHTLPCTSRHQDPQQQCHAQGKHRHIHADRFVSIFQGFEDVSTYNISLQGDEFLPSRLEPKRSLELAGVKGRCWQGSGR